MELNSNRTQMTQIALIFICVNLRLRSVLSAFYQFKHKIRRLCHETNLNCICPLK